MKPLRLLLLLFAVATLLTSSSRRQQRFEDFYECYIIVDAEVADYGSDDYEQVDYEILLGLVSRARHVPIAFHPAKQVNLYDDDGIRYNLYISHSCAYVSVDSDTFRLSRHNRRALKRLIS